MANIYNSAHDSRPYTVAFTVHSPLINSEEVRIFQGAHRGFCEYELIRDGLPVPSVIFFFNTFSKCSR
jgi:hypothetical protein